MLVALMGEKQRGGASSWLATDDLHTPQTLASLHERQNFCTSAISMVSSTQDKEGDDLAIFVIWWNRFNMRLWNLLPDALMRPGTIEVLDIGPQHPLELPFTEDE